MSDSRTITVYGIRQCDSCRKALRWLEEQGIDHRFHDLRQDGLSAGRVRQWLRSPVRDRIVNRRSTTWRQLSGEEKVAEGDALVALLVAHPTLVKRPVFTRGDAVLDVGFAARALEAKLAS